MGIRVTQVRNTDLNLLVYFTVLAEERSLTRAAKRLFLTQPSMTRALQKLRDLLADDLLIRTSTEYNSGKTPYAAWSKEALRYLSSLLHGCP
jgi:Bacterial regulatory helix-turn-helix protein, lysR family